jgi:hypothetical protein
MKITGERYREMSYYYGKNQSLRFLIVLVKCNHTSASEFVLLFTGVLQMCFAHMTKIVFTLQCLSAAQPVTCDLAIDLDFLHIVNLGEMRRYIQA